MSRLPGIWRIVESHPWQPGANHERFNDPLIEIVHLDGRATLGRENKRLGVESFLSSGRLLLTPIQKNTPKLPGHVHAARLLAFGREHPPGRPTIIAPLDQQIAVRIMVASPKWTSLQRRAASSPWRRPARPSGIP